MLYLRDSSGIVCRATLTNKPNLGSLSKWFNNIKYINEEPVNFYYTKSNGAHFYFEYKGAWHKILKGSWKKEELKEYYVLMEAK